VWITPDTGGILRTCPIVSSSSIERSFAQRIASVLTPYLLEILAMLSREVTVCFLLCFHIGASLLGIETIFLLAITGVESHQIRISPVSDI
jgi:hypothetical protein